MKTNIKTKIGKTLHDFAVSDVERKNEKIRSNWRTQLECANSVESTIEYVGINSSLDKVFKTLVDSQIANFNIEMLFSAFQAKYSDTYMWVNEYFGTSYDMDNDFNQFLSISQYCVINPDDTKAQNMGKCLSNWVEWCIKNNVANFEPISFLREREKTIRRNNEKREKKTAKDSAKEMTKNAAKFLRMTKEEKINEKMKEFMKLGCNEDMAKIMAQNYINSLPKIK